MPNMNWLSKPFVVVLLLLLLLGPLYFINLGQGSLWEIDESIYAEIGREMLESGDLVGTYYNYEPRFDKPPLVFWMVVLSYKVFGINEFAVRFFSALTGLAGVLLVYAMVRRSHGSRTAFFTAFILGSCFEYPILAYLGLTDMPLTFFTILTFYGIYLAYQEEKPAYYLLAGLGAALATLTKGPAFLLLPGASFVLLVLLDLAAHRPIRRRVFRPHLAGAVILYLLMALPWYLAMYHRFGADFIADNFVYHMLTRFTKAIESHAGPFYFYPLLLLVALLPWTAGLFGGLRRAFRERAENGNIIYLVWAFVYIVFFSLSRTKLMGYIMPSLPAAALITALWWERFAARPKAGKERWLIPASMILAGGVIALAIWGVRGKVPAGYEAVYRGLYLVPAALGAIGAAMFAAFAFTRKTVVIFGGFIVFALLLLAGLKSILVPAVEPLRPTRELARTIEEQLRPGEIVVSTSHEFMGLPFYLRTKVEFVSMARAEQLLSGDRRVFVAATKEAAARLIQSDPDLVVLREQGRGSLISNQ